MKKIYILLLSLGFFFAASAQKADFSKAAELVKAHATEIGLSKDAQSNLSVSSSYASEGTQYVYLNQAYKGLAVRNQMMTLSFKGDKLASKAGIFLENIDALAKGASSSPSLSAKDAVNAAFAEEKLAKPVLQNSFSKEKNKFDFGQPASVYEKVTGELVWYPIDVKGTIASVNLAWTVMVAPKGTDDMWQVMVDANTGKVLGKFNYTTKDSYGSKNNSSIPNSLRKPINKENIVNTNFLSQSPAIIYNADYLVIPYPAESPAHPGGTAAIRSNPWNAVSGSATALGWHSNGTSDYTISRGNNVWATEDQAATNANTGPAATSSTGAPNLTFNFPPVYTTDPRNAAFQQFSITNLFYWNNIIHDITYQYGFTEPAGNFQNSNQGLGGNGNDDVIGLAQSGAAGSIGNNANFSTPPDGGRGRMRMYLWNGVPSAIVHVNSPVLPNPNYNAVESGFSMLNLIVNVGQVTGEVVSFLDPSGGLGQACGGPPTNNMTGKIALINRGNCTFIIKVKEAQNAGAIGVIMVNNVATAPITMGGTDNTITIPAVMVSQANGQILADLIPGLNVTLGAGIPLDGDLDNGVISHEFTHGISNRLTGGPNNTSCLSNAEQAGEGWSDYVGLMLTTNWVSAQLTDGSLPRAIGNYVIGQSPTTGTGIRNYPYSTNIVTNPLTYANMGVGTIGTEVHNIGEIWCMAIWEMTWGIIQQEGVINPNLYNFSNTTTGGNSISLKLVLEGMKLQPCSPGYVDGRDAILAADRNLYNGRHACSIWTAFAKRGLGYGANQGSSNSATDQTASTTLPPAPTVTTQPVDVSTASGTTATFTASAGADVNLIYQWQVSTDGGSTWTDIVGQITSTLTLTNVTTAMNANKYRAKVFIGCASTNTSNALLTVTGGATLPAITTQPSATAVCAGANATFTAAASGTSNTYVWQVSTNNGSTWAAVVPAASTTTLTLTSVTVSMNGYQYRLVATNGTGSVNSNGAVLTVNALPAVPTATSPVTYCQGATATALTATGTSLLWYTVVTGGTGSTTAPIPSTTASGNTNYYVSQTVSTCESPRTLITVTIVANPPLPNIVNTSISYCQGATATALAPDYGGNPGPDPSLTLVWYTVPTGGTALPAAPTPSTVTLGPTVYYLAFSNGICVGPRQAITVTITAVPAAPTVTTPITYCQGVTAVALSATGSNLLWYANATGGTGSLAAPTPSTVTVGSTTYYVSQTTGCESPRAAITVNVVAGTVAPTVTSPVTYCQGATASVLTASGSGLLWYNAATGGTGSTTAPTPSTTTAGSTIYYVSQTSGSCESPRAAINVTVNATPAAPTVTSPVSYCQNATAIALTATGTNLLWYTVATGGTGSTTAPTPSTTTLGTTNYYVSQTIGTCEGTRALIAVNITAVPAAPSVTTPVTYCQNATATTLTATGSNLMWYTTGTGGTGTATAPTPSTTTVGSTTYYVSQTTGCESPRASIIVNITAAPAAPTVTSAVTYCQGATATQLTATGSNLLWYNAATGGTGSTTAPTPSTTTAGSTIYYVSQTSGSCESPRAAITVTVNAIPAAPTVTSQVIYCQNVTATALTATGSNLLWYTVPTGGTGSSTAPTPSTTAAGSTTYYVSQTISGCVSTRASILVTVNATPAVPTVGGAVTYCQNTTATALTATGSSLLWYNAISGGTGSNTAPTPTTTTVGTTSYYVSQTVNGCESPRASIAVTVLTAPAAPVATSPIAYCQGSTAVALTATGTNLTWYSAATGSTSTATAPIPSTATTGSTSYFVSQTTGTCESPRTEIIVNVSAAPAITTQPQDITSCATSATFSVVATGTSLTYQWFLSTDGGTTYTAIAGATNSTVTINGLTTAQSSNKYRVVISSGSCTAATSNSVTARVGTSPVVVLTASPTVSTFNPYTNGGLFTTISPVGNYTYEWKRNNTIISNTTSSLTKANGLLDDFGSYIVTVKDVVTGCTGVSKPESVSDVADQIVRMFVSPNPSQGMVRVWYYSNANTTQAKSVNVYDSKGSRVLVKELGTTPLRYGSVNVDMTSWQKDTYVFILLDASGKNVGSQKVIRN